MTQSSIDTGDDTLQSIFNNLRAIDKGTTIELNNTELTVENVRRTAAVRGYGYEITFQSRQTLIAKYRREQQTVTAFYIVDPGGEAGQETRIRCDSVAIPEQDKQDSQTTSGQETFAGFS